MAERVLGPTGSRRRRRLLLVPMLVVSAIALMFVAGAQAVHGEAFQLDGDVAREHHDNCRRRDADRRLGQPVRREWE